MLRTLTVIVTAAWLAASGAAAADGKYQVKTAQTPPPKELAEPIRALLGDTSYQLTDDKGALVCEVWFRKEVPSKAAADQVQKGLTYRELDESVVLGAIRYDKLTTDYRKQKVKPGVYTMRLGFQPMDGDHMGTAPYPDFCLIVPARLDKTPDLMEAKQLQEMSAKAIGASHPGVLLLFPNEKPADTPRLADKGNNTWALEVKEPVALEGGKKAALGVGLTLVGHTTAE